MEFVQFVLVMLFYVALVILSIFDIRNQKIPMIGIISVLAIGTVTAILSIFEPRHMPIGSLAVKTVLSVIPGLLLLFLAKLTGKVGPADGMVVCAIGLMTNYLIAIFSLGIAAILLSLLSMALMLGKKVNKNTTLPFIPFLSVSYLIGGVFLGK